MCEASRRGVWGLIVPAALAASVFSTGDRAEAFQAAKKAAAPTSAAPAVLPRSAVAFGFGGKVGPKEEGYVPGFESYRLRFGPGDWDGTRIIITSAWGDKNTPTDLWNWPDGLSVKATDARKDKDGYYFVYSLATANDSDWIIANFRITLKDGRNGVANALIPYAGKPDIPQTGAAVLVCDGKLGPRDEGYVAGFESYRLRFGPGDWEGSKILVSSNWGEGTNAYDNWGWRTEDEARSSEVKRDARGAYFIHSLQTAGHSRWVASMFRFARKDGRPGVAQAMYSYSGALTPPRPVGQPPGYPTAPAPTPRKSPRPTARTLAAARPTQSDLDYLRSISDEFKAMGLNDLAELTKLDLDEKGIDDAGMVHLRGLRQLRFLSLSKTRVGDIGLENIAGLANLQELDLISTPTTDAGLETLSRLPNLTSLAISGTEVTDAGIKLLRRLRNLQSLAIANTDVGDVGLAALKDLPKLEFLNIGKDDAYVSEPYTEAGMAVLKGYPSLVKLILSHLPIGDAHLARIAGMRKLLNLDLTATKVTDAGLVHIKSFPALVQLDLSQTPVTGAGLANLGPMPRLKYFFLGFQNIGDAGLAHIGKMKELEYLHIVKGEVTDAGLVHLRGLPKLDRLGFPDNKKITGAGVRHLRGLTGLGILNLYATSLDNSALEAIGTLTGLYDLEVSGEGITDDGLVHLKSLKNLHELSISWTKATQAGIDDLKRTFPKLEVRFGDF